MFNTPPVLLFTLFLLLVLIPLVVIIAITLDKNIGNGQVLEKDKKDSKTSGIVLLVILVSAISIMLGVNFNKIYDHMESVKRSKELNAHLSTMRPTPLKSYSFIAPEEFEKLEKYVEEKEIRNDLVQLTKNKVAERITEILGSAYMSEVLKGCYLRNTTVEDGVITLHLVSKNDSSVTIDYNFPEIQE